MKKLLLLPTWLALLCATSLTCFALPTYEPFTEFATILASNPTNLVVTTTNGVSIGTNANASISNCLDLATGGYMAPGGEQWGSLNFSATGTEPLRGLDIAIVSNVNIFTQTALSSLLPATFPGMPASGQSITNFVENPAQPALWGTTNLTQSNYVGNSAVLKFASDITRPTNGTTTLYVSYLLSIAQVGQLGPNNDGRYLDFVAASNLVEGVGSGSYSNWSAMFNTFNTTNVRYCGHGVLESNASFAYIGACDASTGKDMTSSPFLVPLTTNPFTPVFVVGAYVFSANGKDTNLVWINPPTNGFGGTTPPLSPVSANVLATNMNDIGGLVLEDRVGNGALGGVGTNYVANLIIGSTWSFVTGGPEFTTQPPSSDTVALGRGAIITVAAVAAGQTVSYQWQVITGGATNNLVDGQPTAPGGTATVSGSQTSTLTLSGIDTADLNTYQCVATASSTGYTLASSQVAVVSDPVILAQPQNATVNYGAQATFSSTITTTKSTLSYQWYLGSNPLTNGLQSDGSTVNGASGTVSGGSETLTLTLTNVSYLDEGNYSVVATNNVNNAITTTAATLIVNDPYIVTQPANPAVAAGGTATFTIVAAGSPTISYQWFENGSPLSDGNPDPSGGPATVSGSHTATLTLAGVGDRDNGSYTCMVIGSSSGQSVTSAAAVLTVQDPLTVVSTPVSRTERVGDHLAFTVNVSGGGPSLQWTLNGAAIAGATSNSLVLTNIQTTNGGIYSIVVSNLATPAITNSATLTVINSPYLTLAQTNVLVVRVGDGVQTLSGNTGNTIYLDQYTTNGTYVSTVQIPDEKTGQAYGAGSASSVYGSPALLVAGAGTDATYEGFLTTSGGNGQYLDLAGYCQQYPFTGGTVNTDPASNWRGLATLNAFGVYSLAYTNYGLYSGGNQLIHAMVTLDGNSFWVTGEAGSLALKYVNLATGASYATGTGIPTLASSGTGPRVVQIFNNNLVFSDADSGSNNAAITAPGIYLCQGLPEPVPDTTSLMINEGGQPNDFAISPDGKTVYVADSQSFGGANSQSGGIQRWDTNTGSGGFTWSYTLPVEPNDTLGAQGLTVDFSATGTWGSGVTGAVLYATSSEAASNTVARIVDAGPSSTPLVLATAGPNQALRGVRFGPVAVPVSIATEPAGGATYIGNSYTFTVGVNGSQPLYYQWSVGGNPIPGATGPSLTLSNLSTTNAGSYLVTISNLVPSSITSTRAVLSVSSGVPSFTVPSFVETVGDHLSFAPTVNGSQPFYYSWSFNSTNISTNSTVTLTNIQTSNSGTYTLVVTNSYGKFTNSGTLTVTTGLQSLSSNNLVVARIGDGVQTLSGATGNTIYLDQYTTSGAYSNTIQIPDEGTGTPYGTGSSSSASMPFGSPALLVSGANGNEADAGYEAFLTLSADTQSLDFIGYCQAYPFSGPDLTIGANVGTNWRGVGEVNGYGAYSLVYTNTGLYSEGNHQVHDAVTEDGINYWTTGQAGGGLGLKYVTPSFEPANGAGIPSIAGSFFGTRAVRIVASNIIFSDIGDPGIGPVGIFQVAGLTGLATNSNPTNIATLLIGETNSPMDFAFSPDLNTVYIADNGSFLGTNVPTGGIQRWDTNSVGGGYTYSYTLGTGSGSTVGARGLTASFSAHSVWGAGVTGATVYATTAEASGNRLITVVDAGPGSSATALVTASASQMLAGVSFGPVLLPATISANPTNQSVLAGNNATFSVGLSSRDGPFTYNWYYQSNCPDGPFTRIIGANQASLTVTNVSSTNVGCYTVEVCNSIGCAESASAALSLQAPPAPPQFVSTSYSASSGFTMNFTGPVGEGYTIRNNAGLTGAPALESWNAVTTGTFSSGTNTYTDPNAINSQQLYYIITIP